MTDIARLIAVLEEQLPDHLARQRWSDASRGVTRAELLWHELIRTDHPLLLWGVARVWFTDDGTQDVQLFAGARRAHELPPFLEGKEREAMAIAAGVDGGDLIVYDALVDPDLAIDVLHLVAPDAPWSVPRPLVLEHANSSVVFDESVILKVFRRVGPGVNADAEIPRVLAARGYEHVLPPLAELSRDGVDLAVLRPFLVGAASGWQLARTSLRDVLASRLPPDEAGGDLAPDAERMGAVLGTLHVALGEAFGVRPGDPAGWAAELGARLRQLSAGEAPHLPPDVDRGDLLERYEAVAELPDAGSGIRVHGNVHLDQLIMGDVGWRVLDFEGAAVHRRPDGELGASPLQDLAGLLRSLHEVAVAGLTEWDLESEELADLTDRWEQRCRAAVLRGYLGSDGIEALLPADAAAREVLLTAFEIDRTLDRRGRRAAAASFDRDALVALLGTRATA